ncbi:hypothetical protein [Hyphomicrobium sp.]|uniref:hypothetical protein n=1 Tax=Hyphomicrobium sp. TaxID=82 RepID=UPI001E197B8E|nr:hypothetical protein [Hyphomicrobium sp.]MBY0561470.1 hypothetical protein [Hyphomicrobium sp.]
MDRAGNIPNLEPFDRLKAAIDAQLSGAALQGRATTKAGCPAQNFFPFFLGCIARTDPEAARGIISIFEMALLDHAEDLHLMAKYGSFRSVNPVSKKAGNTRRT